MSEQTIPPALSPEQWTQFLEPHTGNGSGQLQLTLHGTAAIAMYNQPYGFTDQDVDDEEQVAEYCDRMADAQENLGEYAMAETFRNLGSRHRIRAAKIAALLPPRS